MPYPPGGSTDTVTRLVTQRVSEALGQPIVVENRPGANSILGADLAAKAAPDGYTFLTVIAAHAANATLYAGKLPFDPVKSFASVSLAASAPLILTVSNAFPAKDMRELIAYAKANPGKVSFGSSGIGAAAHLTTELLKQTAGIDMVHVPYKGTAPALQGGMANDIQILVDVPSSTMPPAWRLGAPCHADSVSTISHPAGRSSRSRMRAMLPSASTHRPPDGEAAKP